MMSSKVKFLSGSKIVPHSDFRAGTTQEGKARNKNTKRIACWNVRTLLQCGKLENLKNEMRRNQIDIMGISEMRWPLQGDFWTDEYRIIHTQATVDGNGGVGIMLKKDFGQRVIEYTQHNERLLKVRLNTKPKDTVIIQVYMPTTAHDEEEVEELYENIEQLIKHTKGDENLIVMGDWNAVVGEGKEGDIVGQYGLGKRNIRGERLIEFCDKHKLNITNTIFRHHVRRRYTWKMPGDINRYQIDYIMVKQRFKNQAKDSRSYAGPDIDSDHNVVIMKYRLNLKKLKKKESTKWNLDSLKDEEKIKCLQQEIKQEIDGVEPNDNIENRWKQIEQGIIKGTEKVLGKKINKNKKPWITAEIINLMDQRRKYKNISTEQGQQKYRQLRNRIQRECKKAKEDFMTNKCAEIQRDITEGRSDKAYRNIKSMFRTTKPKNHGIMNKNGEIITENKGIVKRWKEYLEELYKEDEGNPLLELERNNDIEEKPRPILRVEFDRAVQELKNNKTPGIDGIPSEVIKSLHQDTLDKIFSMMQDMYNMGEIPSSFTKTQIVTIPKKAATRKCEEHRTISLISHASKILIKILYRRIEQAIEENLTEDQFGFRRNTGTKEAILALRLIIEKMIGKGKELYIAFIDAEKAFDRVNWKQMFDVLTEIGIDNKERQLIYNIYKNQSAIIEYNGEKEVALIRRGVRQGCGLSPLLFNIYIQQAINEFRQGRKTGVCIHGERIDTIRYADDIALLAETKEDLIEALTDMDEIFHNNYNIKINKSKTKVMVCSKNNRTMDNINVGNEPINAVEQFAYLGSLITEDGRSTKEINKRINHAKRAFYDKKQLLTSNGISTNTKKQFIKTYIWSIALYGCETWTIGKTDRRKIEAFEMWCYRRALKISWTQRKTNEEVLEQIQERRRIWRHITKRRTQTIGHILRRDGLIKTIIEGKVNGKNPKGRPRLQFIKQIIQDSGSNSYEEMKRKALDRGKWKAATNQSQD